MGLIMNNCKNCGSNSFKSWRCEYCGSVDPELFKNPVEFEGRVSELSGGRTVIHKKVGVSAYSDHMMWELSIIGERKRYYDLLDKIKQEQGFVGPLQGGYEVCKELFELNQAYKAQETPQPKNT